MVRVGARLQGHMQGDAGIEGEGAEELLEQLGVHVADLVAGEGDRPGEEGAAGDVDRRLGQGLVHRQQGLAVAADAALVAERLAQRLAEHDADILGGVVEVDMQVALGLHRQVQQGVAAERRQHVVEEADAGGDLDLARAVERQGGADIGLGRGADDGGGAGGGHGRFLRPGAGGRNGEVGLAA